MDIQTAHSANAFSEEELLEREATESLSQQLFMLLAGNQEYYHVNKDNGLLQTVMLLSAHIPSEMITNVADVLKSSFGKLEQQLKAADQENFSISVTTQKVRGFPAIALSFNTLKGDTPEQAEILTKKAMDYFFLHREAIAQGIHDAIFSHKAAPAITNITEELRNAPGTARTLLAASAFQKPVISQTLEEQRQKNHVEKLAYPLLELFLGKATYDIAETDDGDKLVATVRLKPGISKAELGSAMQALHESFSGLKERKAEGFVPRIIAAPQRDGSHNVSLIFDDLQQITQKEAARSYLENNKAEIARGIRTAIFGEQTAKYLQ